MGSREDFMRRVANAREACAGSNIQSLAKTRWMVREAIVYGTSNCLDRKYLIRLTEAVTILDKATTYGDRLPADDILCGILNDLHHEGGE